MGFAPTSPSFFSWISFSLFLFVGFTKNTNIFNLWFTRRFPIIIEYHKQKIIVYVLYVYTSNILKCFKLGEFVEVFANVFHFSFRHSIWNTIMKMTWKMFCLRSTLGQQLKLIDEFASQLLARLNETRCVFVMWKFLWKL